MVSALDLPTYDHLMEELRRIREQHGIQQNELADAADIDNAYLSRMEHTHESATYETVQRVCAELTNQIRANEATASDVMHSPISDVSASTSCREAIELMTQHDFSQLPVSGDADDTYIGRVTDALFMAETEYDKPVRDVMGPRLLEIATETPISSAEALLEGEPAVLVVDHRTDDYVGIVTKFDIIEYRN